MSRNSLIVFCIFLLLWAVAPAQAMAESSPVQQVILVLWHGLEWEDLKDIKIREQTTWPMAYGLMNTRAGGGDLHSGAYMSLGAGARAVGFAGAATFQWGLGAQALYTLRVGEEPGIFVQPDLALIKDAQRVNYRVEIGALGSAFANKGVPLRVLGNSDGNESVHWAALVGMDSLGRVWRGTIDSSLTLENSNYPFGLHTDYDRLAKEVLQGTEPLIVVDLGDPYRYEQYQKFLLPEQRDVLRKQMVQEAGDFLERIVSDKPANTVVLVVSPFPSGAKVAAGQFLTPILCLGWSEGLLSSATTRWPGLVTNMDLAPTILKLLGIEHQQPMIGRSASIEAAQNATSWIETMEKKTSNLAKQRPIVLRAVVIFQIVIYSVILASLILSISLPEWMVRLGQSLLLVLLILPLALLFWDGPRWILAVFLLVMLLFQIWPGHILLKVGMITAVTTLLLSYDLLGGSWFMRYSPLGYDPIGGARFYGIGNEFMGVLVGATVIAWSICIQQFNVTVKWQWISGIILFGSIIFLIGAPSLGTNVGGAICAVFAFGFLFGKKKLPTAIALIAIVAAVLAFLMLLDYGNPATKQSHIGQTVALFRQDGFWALQLIIVRKLAMNFKLLRYSMWSRVLLVGIAVLGASFIWPSQFIFWLKENHPQVAKGVIGVVVGSIAAFFFNDSGVVAAATCLTFASTTLLLLALELKHNLNPPQSHIENDTYNNQTGECGTSPGGNKG